MRPPQENFAIFTAAHIYTHSLFYYLFLREETPSTLHFLPGLRFELYPKLRLPVEYICMHTDFDYIYIENQHFYIN